MVDAVRHGLTNRQIASRRGTSVDAVKYHVANALMKLGFASRAELKAWRGIPAGSAAASKSQNGDTAMVQLGAIGQISRPVGDITKAVHWYGEVLGLPHLYTFGDLAFFDCGGTRLFLSASDEAGDPSVLYFRVEDINAAYDELVARGIEFEGAPHLIHEHDDGVEEWMAFFRDPDGHFLALMSQV